jgi:DNA repair exonuclease SbcCD ATPase subunit
VVDGEQLDTPVMDARGGGVAAVIGFLLRLVILLLTEPPVRHVMFLDESFAQLSVEYEPALAEFIKELTERTNMQVVLVTHSTAFDDAADKSYRFELRDGVTKVEALG